MKSVSGESRAVGPRIALCPRCKRETLPPLLRGNPLFRDAHRSATEGMVKEAAPDPRAERKRRQKERKAERRQLRHAIRTEGIAMAAHLFLDARAAGYRETAPEDDCPACLALQQRAA